MTPNEKKILRPAIRWVVRHDKDAWWRLKREIWDSGYQSYYDAQGDFLEAATRAMGCLSPEEKSKLIDEWKKKNPQQGTYSENSFIATYTLLILLEVIERGRTAAYRTINW
jgi:hypothetical protein